jgi:hypothetical protein
LFCHQEHIKGDDYTNDLCKDDDNSKVVIANFVATTIMMIAVTHHGSSTKKIGGGNFLKDRAEAAMLFDYSD